MIKGSNLELRQLKSSFCCRWEGSGFRVTQSTKYMKICFNKDGDDRKRRFGRAAVHFSKLAEDDP